MTTDTWLAIDFGTSNSLVAGADTNGVFAPIAIDPHAPDQTIMKSVIYSLRRNEWAVGTEAISLYYEAGAEGRVLKSLKKFLPDPSFQGTQIHGQFYSLEDLLARILRTMRERAEKARGQSLTKVVLGHPALFAPTPEGHQRALTRLEKSANIAGFTDIVFCPEPVAAAHNFAKSLANEKIVLVADFGGGTSDFTIIRLKPSGFTEGDVLSLGGVSLAGDAFDGSIMEHAVAPFFGSKIEFRMPMGSNTLNLPKALVRKLCSPADLMLLGKKEYIEFFRNLQQWSLDKETAQAIERLEMLIEERQGYHLFESIEEGKKMLSAKDYGHVHYQYPTIDLDLTFDRGQFDHFSSKTIDAILGSLDETVKASGLAYAGIDIVCCTGGTARIPALHAGLAARLGADKLEHHLPFHAVVNGLAEKAFSLVKK
ncbi:MAG: Hsp70 family protein [Bdellovibrionota bacterium]